MRNIVEHPVTREEVIQALETLLKQEMDKEYIGGLTPMILGDILETAKQIPAWYNFTFANKEFYEK